MPYVDHVAMWEVLCNDTLISQYLCFRINLKFSIPLELKKNFSYVRYINFNVKVTFQLLLCYSTGSILVKFVHQLPWIYPNKEYKACFINTKIIQSLKYKFQNSSCMVTRRIEFAGFIKSLFEELVVSANYFCLWCFLKLHSILSSNFVRLLL